MKEIILDLCGGTGSWSRPWNNIPQLGYHKPETDAEFRAMTPPGFAKAFFEANRKENW